jgi:hypothetical protein
MLMDCIGLGGTSGSVGLVSAGSIVLTRSQDQRPPLPFKLNSSAGLVATPTALARG